MPQTEPTMQGTMSSAQFEQSTVMPPMKQKKAAGAVESRNGGIQREALDSASNKN